MPRRSGHRNKTYGERTKNLTGLIMLLCIHFHTEGGNRVMIHWIQGETDAATVMERWALQASYILMPGIRERQKNPPSWQSMLSALTAAPCRP